MSGEFDYITIEPSEDGVNVYGYGEYPEHSVLAGQTRRVFLDSFETEAEALAKYPDAEACEHSGAIRASVGSCEPDWFDPADAGEHWNEDY